LKRLTSNDASLGELREKAIQEGMMTLRESGIKKMLQGQTTYQEVLRVTWDQT